MFSKKQSATLITGLVLAVTSISVFSAIVASNHRPKSVIAVSPQSAEKFIFDSVKEIAEYKSTLTVIKTKIKFPKENLAMCEAIRLGLYEYIVSQPEIKPELMVPAVKKKFNEFYDKKVRCNVDLLEAAVEVAAKKLGHEMAHHIQEELKNPEATIEKALMGEIKKLEGEAKAEITKVGKNVIAQITQELAVLGGFEKDLAKGLKDIEKTAGRATDAAKNAANAANAAAKAEADKLAADAKQKEQQTEAAAKKAADEAASKATAAAKKVAEDARKAADDAKRAATSVGNSIKKAFHF